MSLEHVDVGRVRIAFRRAGQGPPLVLLHGAVSDSRVWRVELDAFADEFDVVAWDAPGCGGSSDPPEGFRMSDFADCLEGLIGELGLERPHVLGHSWGTTLALQLAAQAPATVRSLVLVGAYAGWAGSLAPEEVARRLAFALAAAESVESGGWDPTSMPGLFSDVMPADRAEELVSIMSDIRSSGTRAMAHALAEADLRPALGGLTVPTLLVNGDVDLRSPVDVARELEASIPRATLCVLPGLGHECSMEDAEAFAAAVLPFLRAVDTGAT
jgi:pimeloyl-ACP methyl ester carboxylesterase